MSTRRGPLSSNWKGGISKVCRKCEYCGKTFAARPYEIARCCSLDCARQYRSDAAGQVLTCEHCGKVRILSARDRRKRFCSRACLHAAMSGQGHPNWKEKAICTCEECGARFEKEPAYPKFRNHLFCSLACRYKWHGRHISGENAPGWKGGVSFDPYPAAFNRAFKERIRERDNHICAICRMPGKFVHHVNYVKDDLRPENFITLCKSCHMATNHHRPYWQRALSELLAARLTGANL